MTQNFGPSSLTTHEAVRARARVLAREHRKMRATLVECRRGAGLSQGEVAERMGVSQQAVSKFERYDSDPKLSTVRRYANAVGALIEHRVDRDHGQAELLAASKPEWVRLDTVRCFEIVVDCEQQAQPISVEWTAMAAKQTDLVLGW